VDLSKQRVQYTVTVTFSHGTNFRRYITVATTGLRVRHIEPETWWWQGIGCPQEILDDVHSHLRAVLDEHVTSRYGVVERLKIDPRA
jgi:hypothetical protein